MERSAPTNRQDSALRRILKGPLVYLLVIVAGLWIFLAVATHSPKPRTPQPLA